MSVSSVNTQTEYSESPIHSFAKHRLTPFFYLELHRLPFYFFFFFNDTATPEIYPLPLPAPLPISLLIGAAVLPPAQAGLSAAHASFPDAPPRRAARLKRRLLTAALHLVQPLPPLRGRLKEGLTPWRCRGTSKPAPLLPVTTSMWNEHSEAPDRRLHSHLAAP